MFEGTTLVPMLPAADIERAKRFYSDKLDLKPTSDEDVLRYEAGGSWFYVYPSEFAGTNKATAAAWEVNDIAAVVTELKSRGVEFQEFEIDDMPMENSILTSPTGNKAAWFFDSEGNIIGLLEPPA